MEDHDQELLAFIRGSGKYSIFGNGISTYPNGNENNRLIFASCLRLEQMGLIYRVIDEPDYVLFKAKGYPEVIKVIVTPILSPKPFEELFGVSASECSTLYLLRTIDDLVAIYHFHTAIPSDEQIVEQLQSRFGHNLVSKDVLEIIRLVGCKE